jgi:hypothetical protein
VDFTLALGNPDPDIACAVSPARLHLRRLYRKKYSLTKIAGRPALLKFIAATKTRQWDRKSRFERWHKGRGQRRHADADSEVLIQ